jgi:tetratricopeptide (TPR) repeat protein
MALWGSKILSPYPARILLVLACAFAYHNALQGDFIYDDIDSIVDNKDIRSLWPPRWAIPQPDGEQAINSRPLVSFSLALNYAWGELDVRGYRAFNIAIHALCSLVLFAVLQRSLSARWGETALPLAWVCALLWSLHPLNNQCINYITQRSESLMALFYLQAIYCASRSGYRWQLGAVLCCILSAASKEVAVTAPLVVLLYDRVFLSQSFVIALVRRPWMYAGLALVWGQVAFILSSHPHGDSIGFGHSISSVDYALNQSWVVLGYVSKFFWPWPLVLDYGFTHSMPWEMALGVVAAVALLSGALFCLWRRDRQAAFAAMWFLLILAPTSSMVPIVGEVGAERRVYLPLCAFMALWVVGGYYWLLRKRALYMRIGVVAVLACAFIAVNWQRNREFRTEESVWRSAVAATPNNARAHNNLGSALNRANRHTEASAHYRRALEILPSYGKAYANLGAALLALGDANGALAQSRKAREFEPELAAAYFNAGAALQAMGQYDEAAAEYQMALERDDAYGQAYLNLGLLYKMQGDLERGIVYMRHAADLLPDDALVFYNLGNALLQAGQAQKAIEHYQFSLHIDAEQAEVWNNMGSAWAQLGHYAEAATHFQRAIELAPKHKSAQENLEQARQLSR